ncbi:hypothetical protein [Frigoribacterium sp. VKM Ac-2836]|uniref:hypothetical protein n=1 Tax=Frigoribacterium sp. VKM Ac-2836 TaxID=2739014 RepID=UPI0015662C65|nr:hypothetical protein [Frigoribacterium sp. VKM Ac-2836]NRD25879.1 hypothetical protein [Frigoribacterium sp. VKM Ac-2836]
MADNVQTASVGGIAPPSDDVTFHRRRVTFVAPFDDTVPESSARPDQQEHHPVNQTLAPETAVDRPDDQTDASQLEADPVESAPVTSSVRAPRPVSVPSHRADVVLDDIVPTDAFEARPASVARHSIDTSAITLPVLAVSVPDDLPQPPERLTLDDEVLARLVEKRLEDTATIDLMAVVQAQLALRAVEAARFASWEDQITRVGTDEAARALEATRLRFTGVLPVVTPGAVREPRPVVEAGQAPVASATALDVARTPVAASTPPAVVGTSTGPEMPVAHPAGSGGMSDALAATDPQAAADQEALVGPAVSSPDPQAVASAPVPPLPGRPLALVGVVTAALVVVAALVLAFVPALAVASAVLATVAVPIATGLVGLAALSSVSIRPDDASRVARRGPIGVVVGVVAGTVVGFGLLLSDLGAFAWQGFLVRAVGITGLSTSVSVVVALLGAAVVAFIVAVMITGFRSTARD